MTKLFVIQRREQQAERELKQQSRRLLRRLGCLVVPILSGDYCGVGGHRAHGAAPGTPDDLVLKPPAVVGFLEYKTASGRRSPEQVRWHEWAERHGYQVATVRTLEEVAEAVRGWR